MMVKVIRGAAQNTLGSGGVVALFNSRMQKVMGSIPTQAPILRGVR